MRRSKHNVKAERYTVLGITSVAEVFFPSETAEAASTHNALGNIASQIATPLRLGRCARHGTVSSAEL